jgi:hypothetical protein
MDGIVVAAIIVGILVVLLVLDWRLNRNRPRPWRGEPQRSADTDTAHNPSGIAGFGPGGGDGGGAG